MKKQITLLLATAFASGLSAQTFVSTTAENKNVVLEEFTGIYCTYCPDGHVVAQGIQDANPNDVVLINIHTGGYAAPNGGDPDFRTPWGDAIAGQSGLSGYPAGTVNRHLFSGLSQGSGTAMSRSNWSGASNTTLQESSYVNVAAQSTIDVQTRQLTVVVEGYYTANGAATNNLNVALLQNNVEGPQTGGSNFNPSAILPNGNYNHQHMLRHLLTGQWGQSIASTTSGTFVNETFSYTIPNDLNGVPYDLYNLDVVVFIAEGQQEVVTGAKSSMNVVLPPGSTSCDLSVATNMSTPSSYCASSVTPEVTVTNNDATATADTFMVSYTYNGGTPVTQEAYGLAPGASTTITFPALTLSAGSHSIAYSVDFSNSATLVDVSVGNNSASVADFSTLSSTPVGSSINEDFESYSLGGDVLNNAILENPEGVNTYVVNNGVSSAATQNIGGFGNSANSWRFRFYTWQAAQSASIVFANIDLSSVATPSLTFSHAYAQYASENDQLIVEASKDCGSTWTTLFDKAGSNLATASPFNTGHYYPQIAEWSANTASMSSFSGESAVMIRFRAVSDYGNNLYIDDIVVGPASSVSELEDAMNIKLFPNPANAQTTISFEIDEAATISYELLDLSGKIILSDSQMFNSGINTLDIDIKNVIDGSYLIRFSNGAVSTVLPLNVVR